MKKKFTKADIIICAVMLIAALMTISAVLHAGNISSDSTSTEEYPVSYKDYNGKVIGIPTGTNLEAVSFEQFPDSRYLYFNGYPDLDAALLSGRIDGFLLDEPAAKSMHSRQPMIDYIKERISDNQYSFAFRKNDEASAVLREQLNDFLAECRADGTLDEMDSVWFGNDESKKVVDMSGLDGKNGTVSVVTTSTDEPFSYIKDGKNAGYDIDVAVRFCRRYGYALKIGDVDFQARIPALVSGQYDFTTSMNVTDERKESVDFSDTVSEGGIVLAVRSSDILSDSAKKTECSDFNGKRAGVITGSLHDKIIEKYLPDSEIYDFNNYSDLKTALEAERIDYFLMTKEGIDLLTADDPNVSCVNEPLAHLKVGAAFPKTVSGDRIRTQFNEFIAGAQADGTLKSIYDYWNSSDSAGKFTDLSGLTGENGVLTFVTGGVKPPVSFVSNGHIAGTDPEIAVRFCRKYGYGVNIVITETDGMIPGIVTGAYDLAMSDLVITDERKQSVNFSVPYNNIGLYIAARKADIISPDSKTESSVSEKSAVSRFFAETAESFNKNFIRESRWKLIVRGIGTTCFITFMSVLIGTVLAFMICMFRRTDSVLAGKISDIYVRLLQGTPTPVLLMMLYYVILSDTGLSAVWSAVIGFSLNFGAYASEIMRSGIDGIDRGQTEAALALGYSGNNAFFRFVFPQAAVNFLPVYSGEAVSLLKSTSVVGYIAVQDLTKMSDIIRSRTYEAFFPLIATAAIYFMIAWIISALLKIVLRTVSPKKKKRGKSL